MEMESTIEQFGSKNLHKNRVHKVLAHSYIFYFVLFLFGLLLDFIFPVILFENVTILWTGFIFLIFGTFLIIWAQMSSHKLVKEGMSKDTFCNGPYYYTRTPTHYGLFFLMFGFGILSNALFIIIFSIISFIVTKFVFIKKEEEILTLKYGTPYLEYKKSVRF